MWWIIGTEDKTQFVSWSCGTLDKLGNASIYRSQKNAETKIKQLMKYNPGYYPPLIPILVNVSLAG